METSFKQLTLGKAKQEGDIEKKLISLQVINYLINLKLLDL
jgi:hypothetical protein